MRITPMQFQSFVTLWFRLLFRAAIRIERQLDRLLIQQQDLAQLLKASHKLQETTDRLERAIRNQE